MRNNNYITYRVLLNFIRYVFSIEGQYTDLMIIWSCKYLLYLRIFSKNFEESKQFMKLFGSYLLQKLNYSFDKAL